MLGCSDVGLSQSFCVPFVQQIRASILQPFLVVLFHGMVLALLGTRVMLGGRLFLGIWMENPHTAGHLRSVHGFL